MQWEVRVTHLCVGMHLLIQNCRQKMLKSEVAVYMNKKKVSRRALCKTPEW